jgi:hypothetical protein
MDPIDVLNIKLKRFKKYFKGWGSNLFGNERKRKNELKVELESLESMEEESGLSPEMFVRKSQIFVELQNLFAEEELQWIQKAHEKWLLWGDQNTSYFHRICNGRKRKNTVILLKDGDVNIEGTENLVNHATSFYKSLFGPAPGNLIDIDENMWDDSERLSEDDNLDLCRPFSMEEIKKALFEMRVNRAPGPDNILIEFYQHYWEFVKGDIFNLFTTFHSGTLDIQRINYGIITLLPKVSDADKITQYRPICLLRYIYKLITKVLTIRLEPYAGKLFSKNQNAFIKKINIMDGILSLQEIFHHTHVKKKVGVVLKLDFEKAYDKVNWDFLLSCHQAKGFCEMWCGWIKKVLHNGTISVKMNNVCGPYFQSCKGVRQGDPLSPTLFNMAGECLTKMILNAQKNGLLVGLVPKLLENGVAVLQYADDTVFLYFS